jgi:hypothetical protein
LDNCPRIHGLSDRRLGGGATLLCGQEACLGMCQPLALMSRPLFCLDPFECRREAGTVKAPQGLL